MAFDSATAIAQIEVCLASVDNARNASRYDDLSGGLPADQLRAVLVRCLAAIERLAPAGSPYVAEARAAKGNTGEVVLVFAGILQALRDDYNAGYLRSVEELIHADVFGDFLGMADELHGKGYKDPAAVIAGSVLEEHLRRLAAAHGVQVETDDGRPVPADRINADLVKADAYTKLEQSQVTASLALRNRAAHGRYDEYDLGQVAGLIHDVRGFMLRHPA